MYTLEKWVKSSLFFYFSTLINKLIEISFNFSDVTNESEDTKTKLRVTMVGWTLDDSKVVTAVSDYSIKVWDSFNGKLCHILKVCGTIKFMTIL